MHALTEFANTNPILRPKGTHKRPQTEVEPVGSDKFLKSAMEGADRIQIRKPIVSSGA